MNEHDPVDDTEFVFRRIPRVYYDARLQVPVQREAFRPNANDTTGLSVYRARFVQPHDTLANLDPAKAKDYYIAQLSVADLHNLGLTVIPDPVPGGALGHAVIPELSWPAYQARKQALKPVLVELTKLASANIVHHAAP